MSFSTIKIKRNTQHNDSKHNVTQHNGRTLLCGVSHISHGGQVTHNSYEIKSAVFDSDRI
jgi:hypothetical protein